MMILYMIQKIVIPDKFLIKSSTGVIKDIVKVIYPEFLKNMSCVDYLRHRSVLTPINAVVGDINDYIFDRIPGEEHTYYSQDSLANDVGEKNEFSFAFPVEYLNSINMPCLPKHELKLKLGTVVMLMRNLN